jgi:hypothetical protein
MADEVLGTVLCHLEADGRVKPGAVDPADGRPQTGATNPASAGRHVPVAL